MSNTPAPLELNLEVGNPRRKGGILAVHNRVTGQAYFVATHCLRKRLYDQRYWLEHGTHPNRALQSAWTADQSSFAIGTVEEVSNLDLLPLYKQLWIDRFRQHQLCLNEKNGVQRFRRRQGQPPSNVCGADSPSPHHPR